MTKMLRAPLYALMRSLLPTLALAAAAGFLLAGCTASRTLQDDAAVHAVAVVSLVDEAAEIRRVGFTVFGNGQDSLPQGGKLQQIALDTVRQRLQASRPGWTVKNAELPAAGGGKAGPRRASDNAAALAELARRLGVDQVFVIQDTNSENFPGRGVGIAFRTMGSAAGPAMVHAYVALAVLDREGKVLVTRGAIKDNPHMTPLAELGLRTDLGNLGDAAVRDKLSQALQLRLKGAVEEALGRAGY